MANDPVSATGRRVGRQIRVHRERLGWSLDRLAEEMTRVGRDINRTSIARAERGERRVDADDLVGFAEAFGTSVPALLVPTEDEARSADPTSPRRNDVEYLDGRRSTIAEYMNRVGIPSAPVAAENTFVHRRDLESAPVVAGDQIPGSAALYIQAASIWPGGHVPELIAGMQEEFQRVIQSMHLEHGKRLEGLVETLRAEGRRNEVESAVAVGTRMEEHFMAKMTEMEQGMTKTQEMAREALSTAKGWRDLGLEWKDELDRLRAAEDSSGQ